MGVDLVAGKSRFRAWQNRLICGCKSVTVGTRQHAPLSQCYEPRRVAFTITTMPCQATSGSVGHVSEILAKSAVENRLHVHDLHVTILHLMGIQTSVSHWSGKPGSSSSSMADVHRWSGKQAVDRFAFRDVERSAAEIVYLGGGRDAKECENCRRQICRCNGIACGVRTQSVA